MPRDGSGTYNRTDGTRTGSTTWTKAKNAAVKIISTDHDTHDQDIADAITQSVSKDGQTTMTGDLDMGGNKVTNATPTTGTFTPTFRVLGGGSFTYVSQLGYYTVIDDVVYFDLEIQATKVSSPTLYVEIEGLPFVATSTVDSSVTMGLAQNVTLSDRLSGVVLRSTQKVTVRDGTTFLDYSNVTNPLFQISGFYTKS